MINVVLKYVFYRVEVADEDMVNSEALPGQLVQLQETVYFLWLYIRAVFVIQSVEKLKSVGAIIKACFPWM